VHEVYVWPYHKPALLKTATIAQHYHTPALLKTATITQHYHTPALLKTATIQQNFEIFSRAELQQNLCNAPNCTLTRCADN
jgi:hypothetical protein